MTASKDFGALREAFTLNFRDIAESSSKPVGSNTKLLVQKTRFPDGFTVRNQRTEASKSNKPDEQNMSNSAQIRKDLYSYLWTETSKIIDNIRLEIDENAIVQLIDFIKREEDPDQIMQHQRSTKAKSSSKNLLPQTSTDFPLIPTAVVLGGFNSADQEAFYEAFGEAALKKNIRIARLEVMENAALKECIKKIIDQLMLPANLLTEEDETLLKGFCDFDIERLVISRKREIEIGERDNEHITKMAILIPQFERFPVLVMERLLRILVGRKELEITLITGVSTNLESVHQALPKASLGLLDTRVFPLKQSKECLDRIVTSLFLNGPADLKLGSRSFEALYSRFHNRDLTIVSFIRGVQFAYMSHFFGNPLSVFLFPDLEYELLQDEPLHFSLIRSLKSFRSFVERGLEDIGFEDPQAAELKALLEDDEVLFDWTKDKIDAIFRHAARFSAALKALMAIQSLFAAKSLRKPVRSLYFMGIKDDLATDNHIQTCVSLFSVQTNEVKRKFLVELEATMEENGWVEDKEVISALLEEIPEDVLDSDESESDSEDEGIVELEEESRKRAMASDMNKIKKRRKTKSAKKAGTVLLLDDDRTKAKIRKDLMAFFKSALSSYKKLPLHEIVYFEDSSNLISKTFHTEYRGIIENGIKYPKQYLGCNECTNDISAHMPDVTILFKLYLECGRLINLQDWFDAFKSIVDKNNLADDDDELEKKLQARFSRGIEDLRLLGFIRHTGRKTDHVMKIMG